MKKGFTLLESVLAIALASIFFLAIVDTLIFVNTQGVISRQESEALWANQEALGALQTIAFSDLDLIEDGSLSWADDQWNIVGGSEVLSNGMERKIDVEEVYRDSECMIVEGGGDVDPDSFWIRSTINWTSIFGNTRSTSAQTLVTNWQSPSGPCFAPEEADLLTLDISFGNWSGQKQLRDVYLRNLSTKPVTVTGIRLTWSNSELIQQVFFDTTKVWSGSGPGLPAGYQLSGTFLDTVDRTIDPGTSALMHKVQFTDIMTGTTIEIELTFSDGSVLSSGPFVPTY